jgi:hypothetical protein
MMSDVGGPSSHEGSRYRVSRSAISNYAPLLRRFEYKYRSCRTVNMYSVLRTTSRVMKVQADIFMGHM